MFKLTDKDYMVNSVKSINIATGISTNMIEHSFKKCGISNNLDGMDDDVIFEDVCPMRAPPVSDADDSDTDMWDDAAVPVPAAFFDSDDSDFEGF